MTLFDAERLRERADGRPIVLDLFCCAGGATRGYQNAGFYAVGVDLDKRPDYCGDEFVQADAVEFAGEHANLFDFVHASPPCQRHSRAQKLQKRSHPDLVPPTREVLNASGKPWVIENVVGAPLKDPVMLCGVMFGLRTYRHRLFETGGGFEFTASAHYEHVARNAKMGRKVQDGEFMHVVGNFSGMSLAREVMGIDWMSNRHDLAESLPPAYTKYIGREFLRSV